MKNLFWCAVAIVGTLAFICFAEGIKVSGQNMAGIGLGLAIVVGSICAVAGILSWAGKAKDEHERRVKDGSISYRFSQGKYVMAMIIIGLFALFLFYGIFHGLFVPGAGN